MLWYVVAFYLLQSQNSAEICRDKSLIEQLSGKACPSPFCAFLSVDISMEIHRGSRGCKHTLF